MSQLERVKRGVRSPKLLIRKLNIAYHKRLWTREYNTSGVNIFEEDWDNLLILDACRFDLFRQYSDLNGKLEQKTSRGSNTVEFLKGNFAGQTLNDTVYVTANPQLYRNQHRIETELHQTINVWMEDGWNEEYETVLPETTTDYAIQAAKDYPQKRLLVHYIQPHYPFLSSETSFDKGQLEDPENPYSFWLQIMMGNLDLSPDEIWPMYVENLERALASVRDLLDEITGKTVITSDHGNMIGEPSSPIPIREWGHPWGTYTSELVDIPWLVIDDDDRREITSETAVASSEGTESETVKERLQSLGYTE